MEQFKQFNVEKQAAIDTLDAMRTILAELAAMGIDVSMDMEKVEAATKSIGSDVLRIALLGAFSDGKTSVIAAWLGRVLESMNIDMDESSDSVVPYEPEGLADKCVIVDTPGLFGDKVKTVNGEQVMYEDVTKRYISEAHLIFYVVDATNPLKESHAAIAKWLLRDLNKLSATVFVINKMDEVTDLTEQTLFDAQAAIKKDNLKAKLQRAANLTPAEMMQLNIVCIAANPNGRGLPFWFGNPEQYESRSRMQCLKNLTREMLHTNVAQVLIAKTGIDVVRDLTVQKLALAHAQLEDLHSYEQQNREESARIELDIRQGRVEVKCLAGELSKELLAMEKTLLGQLRPLALEDIRGFLEDEIGYIDGGVGHKLHLKIKLAIDSSFVQSSAVTNRISLNLRRQLDSSESFINSMSEKALNSMGGVLKGVSALDPSIIKYSIFIARDALAKVTGIAIKFKPWEASKLAAGLSRWAGPAGALISFGAEFYKAYKAHEQERILTEVKAELSGVIKEAFKDIYDLVADDEKMFDFFAPQLEAFEKAVAGLEKSAELIRTNREKVLRIQEKLDGLNMGIRPALG